MAVGEEEKNMRDGKGFAGLSSLVSDVDMSLPPPGRQETTGSVETAGMPSSAHARQQAAQPESDQQASQPSTGSSPAIWLVGFAVLVGLVLLIAQGGKQPSPQPAAYEPASQLAEPNKSVLPAVPQAPPRPVETMPPVGQGLALSIPQIRYCLAEDIRVDGARAAVNNYIDSDVEQFNAMVTDYNSRCANYLYKRGSLESARREIEQYREVLLMEGRGRLARNQSLDAPTPPSLSAPAPDPTVRAIQRKLNELGYQAGTADGLMGPGTYSAILAFQRENGLAADGHATVDLLESMATKNRTEMPAARPLSPSFATESPQKNSSAVNPTRPEPTRAQNGRIPENSHINYSGDDWECNRGYYKHGNGCLTVQIPANGKLTYSGDDWECDRGYHKRSNSCRPVPIPQYGKLTYSGDDWECSRGYYKYANECRAVQIPQNGKLTYSGDDWECGRGYFKYGGECRAVMIPQNGKLTYSGDDWECSRGYYKSGNSCSAVQVPQNGKLTYGGDDWECEKGYRKSGNFCRPVFSQ